jgi:hypothetical protein
MVTILSADENSFVYNFAKKNLPNTYQIWIGAKRSTSGNQEFEWNNKDPLIYSNWASGEPNYFRGKELFATMQLKHSGTWNDVQHMNLNFICEINLFNE